MHLSRTDVADILLTDDRSILSATIAEAGGRLAKGCGSVFPEVRKAAKVGRGTRAHMAWVLGASNGLEIY